MFSNLQYHSNNSFHEQVTKVAEELGEVIQAKKWKWNIKEEWADLIIAAWVLWENLWLDRMGSLKEWIEKVNGRLSTKK